MSGEQVAKCPLDHKAMQRLWRENGHIADTLRQVIEPPVEVLSRAIEENTSFDAVTAWQRTSSDVITEGLPLGDPFEDPYRDLPVTFFGQAGLAEDYVLPSNPAAKQELIERYLTEYHGQAISGRYVLPENYELAKKLPDILDQLEGAIVEAAVWSRYLVGHHQQRQPKIPHHLVPASGFRRHNVGKMIEDDRRVDLIDKAATGRFASYMYQSTSTLLQNGEVHVDPSGFIFTPVGAYGEDFAKKLLSTAVYTVEQAHGRLPAVAAESVKGYEVAVKEHMARGKDQATPGAAVVASIEEGAISAMQVMALLTAEKVPGYDDPVKLLHDISEAGLIEQFTRAVPMGVVGPFALAGVYFPGIVQNNAGKLQLNPEVMESIKETKRQQIVWYVGYWAAYRDLIKQSDAYKQTIDPPEVTGLICPAAAPHGALEKLQPAMVHALEAIRPSDHEKLLPTRRDNRTTTKVHVALGTQMLQ